MKVPVDQYELQLAAQKVRAMGFLLRHFNTGAALDDDEATGIGAILEGLASDLDVLAGEDQ